MEIKITHNRLYKITRAINNPHMRIQDKKEFATKEGFLTKLKAFISKAFREKLKGKHKAIEGILDPFENIRVIFANNDGNLEDKLRNINSNLQKINENFLFTNIKFSIHKRKEGDFFTLKGFKYNETEMISIPMDCADKNLYSNFPDAEEDEQPLEGYFQAGTV